MKRPRLCTLGDNEKITFKKFKKSSPHELLGQFYRMHCKIVFNFTLRHDTTFINTVKQDDRSLVSET